MTCREGVHASAQQWSLSESRCSPNLDPVKRASTMSEQHRMKVGPDTLVLVVPEQFGQSYTVESNGYQGGHWR